MLASLAAAQPSAGPLTTQDFLGDSGLAAQADAGDSLRFIVHLKGEAELRLVSLPSERMARRQEVVWRLRQTAGQSQAAVLRQIVQLQDSGEVLSVRPLWIINGVAVVGSRQALAALATHPDVQRVSPDERRQYVMPATVDGDRIREFAKLTTAVLTAPNTTGEPTWGLQRIGAPYIWDGLEINGSGVTVAVVDTGVDWTHPALNANYRGNLGAGQSDHTTNWYDAVDGSAEPFDPNGHGTHVSGTAVGQEDLGVAPGARWMAARVLDEYGYGYSSDIHAAFQWLLAPDGDPALAPDVVNNSWGGTPASLAFQEDVEALAAAGILAVFAAGNGGPLSSSITSPASYSGTMAVGASDDIDAVAWFSARGPSALTQERKPTLVAPGTRVFSAWPGGLYAYLNGTSMASPHVAGTAALLLQANPLLTPPELGSVLTETAAVIMPDLPNSTAGWGRLDAYAAVADHVEHGVLQGTVTGDGAALAAITVTVTTPSGAPLAFLTDDNGVYRAMLIPGDYHLTVAYFGYVTQTVAAVTVTAGSTTIRDVNLISEPRAVVTGLVEATTKVPLVATITVEGTPVVVTSDADGYYALSLPAGEYEIRAAATGYRLGQAHVTLTGGQSALVNFLLPPAASVLLVDSGQWLYASQAAYFDEALTGAGYPYELWSIRDPYNDLPTTEDLANYNVVVWSSPVDSPGLLGAGVAISDYLGLGGNLLISGQDLGDLDGYGWYPQAWWYDQLQGRFLGNSLPPFHVSGAAGTLFEGLSFDLNGDASANNQVTPDAAEAQTGSLTDPAFTYDDGYAAGLQAGLCQPFRIVYLGFGLEGVAGPENRAEIAGRALDTFALPRQEVGIGLSPETVDDFALPGQTLTYTITVQNLSESVTDTLSLHVGDGSWVTSLLTETLILGPCESGKSILTLTVPQGLEPSTIHTFSLEAISAIDPAVASTVNFHHRTPGHILLVDDDRFYDQEAIYQAALDAMGLAYDVWDVGWDGDVRGSPSAEFLSYYDIVLWYTGYDWFQPINPAEMDALTTYLGGGGRLFLTSQDYLYYHADDPLTREFLGVISYQESVTPTTAYGSDLTPFLGNLSPTLVLDYGSYQNFSDGVVAAGGRQSVIWHNQGMAAGVASTNGTWRALFWAVPFETLPAAAHNTAMNRVVGWLSDLGDSTFEVDRHSTPASESPGADAARTFTITLHNRTGVTNLVSITNTLPAGLKVDPATITGGAVYDAATQQLTWGGQLDSDEVWPITYQATAVGPLAAGARLDNHLAIHYERHGLTFERIATVWVETPDLSGSLLTFTPEAHRPGDTTILTLRLPNNGFESQPPPLEVISATIYLPETLRPLTDTLAASSGVATLEEGWVRWYGVVGSGQVVTISLTLQSEQAAEELWLPAVALIDDGLTHLLVRDAVLHVAPYQAYFPFFPKNGD